MKLNTIYNEDCLETMGRMPDGFVDLVLTDPPYEIRLDVKRKRWDGNAKNWKAIDNDHIGFARQWFKEVQRVSKHWIVFGANNFIRDVPGNYGWIVWDKRLSPKADNMLGSPFELAITSNPKMYKMYRLLHGGVINADSINGNNEPRLHPTQKPIRLMTMILASYKPSPVSVYDPFFGSGTTLIAAKKLGMKYIGSEISKEYCDIASERLKQEVLL